MKHHDELIETKFKTFAARLADQHVLRLSELENTDKSLLWMNGVGAATWNFSAWHESATKLAHGEFGDSLMALAAASILHNDREFPLVPERYISLVKRIVSPPRHSVVNHAEPVNSLEFSRDGTRLLTASQDGTARIWDVTTGTEMVRLKPPGGITSACFNSDGTKVGTATKAGRITVWCALGGQELISLSNEGAVNSVSFTGDGTQIVTSCDDHTAAVWNCADGSKVAALIGHDASVVDARFSPDDQYIATACSDGKVHLWSNADYRRLLRLDGHDDQINSVRFSADGDHLLTASNDETVRVWKLNTGDELRCLQVGSIARMAVFGPDGQLVVIALDDHFVFQSEQFYDWRADEAYGFFSSDEQRCQTAVAFETSGKRFAISSSDGSTRIYSLASAEPTVQVNDPIKLESAAIVSSDGTEIIAAAVDGTVRRWCASTGSELGCLTQKSGKILAVSETLVATQLSNGLTLLIDAQNGDEVARIVRGQDDALDADFSPCQSKLALFNSNDSVEVWDLSEGPRLISVIQHSHPVCCASFSADGQQLVTGSIDGSVRVWDTVTGGQLISLEKYDSAVTNVSISPSGQHIAVATARSQVYIWSVETAQEVACVEPHSSTIVMLEFQCDGMCLISASVDGLVSAWDTCRGSELYNRVYPKGLGGARLSKSGQELVCTSANMASVFIETLEDQQATERLQIGVNINYSLSREQCYALIDQVLSSSSALEAETEWERLLNSKVSDNVPLLQSIHSIIRDAIIFDACEIFTALVKHFPAERIPKSGIRDRAAGEALMKAGNFLAEVGQGDHFRGFRWAYPIYYQKVDAHACDRTRPMISGPLYTSSEYPWPDNNEPIIQFYLDEIGELENREIGEGLFQLFVDEYGEPPEFRVIPKHKVSREELLPAPSYNQYYTFDDGGAFEITGYGRHLTWYSNRESLYMDETFSDWDPDIHRLGVGSFMHFIQNMLDNPFSPFLDPPKPHFFGYLPPVGYTPDEVPDTLVQFGRETFDWRTSTRAQILFEENEDKEVKFYFFI